MDRTAWSAVQVSITARTFPAYREIAQAGGKNWAAYMLAFKNGFFCPFRMLRDPLHYVSRALRGEAALDAVVRHFVG
jgi:hypothetical protein